MKRIEKFWSKSLVITIFLCFHCSNLESKEAAPKRQPYEQTYSEAKILNSYFKDLFSSTTAGYVIYGEKPIYWGIYPSLHRAIPGSKEHYNDVQSLLALDLLKKSLMQSGDSQYVFVTPQTESSPQNQEFLIVNREAFLKVVKENLVLFKYKFGVDTTAEGMLEKLISPEGGFSALFANDQALQGIVLGYGTDNSISYERASSLMEVVMSSPLSNPPYLPSPPTNEQDVMNIMEKHPLTRTKWKKIKEETKDFSFYRSQGEADHLKIPFSYNPHSKETKSLLEKYSKAQRELDTTLTSNEFFSLVSQKLKLKKNPKDKVSFDGSFTNAEKRDLSKIVTKSILNTFPEEISSDFIDGMRAAQAQENESKEQDFQELRFLDILRDQSIVLEKKRTRSAESVSYLLGLEDATCLIPKKLYVKTTKEGTGQEEFSSDYKAVFADYVIYDIDNKPLHGTYLLEESSELLVEKVIPGLAHGMLGMKRGEIREVYIHPDFAYGTDVDFGKGRALKIKIELVDFAPKGDQVNLPQLKPVDVAFHAPDICSCEEFKALQNKYSYACGMRTWAHYQKAASYLDLEVILDLLSQEESKLLTEKEKALLIKLEWLIYGGQV